MQRTYELMFIVRPDIGEEDMEKLVSTLDSQISGAGGTVKNIERMGRRRLAYTVRKFREGFYVLVTIEGGGELMKEVERRLRVTEPVIKFITVRADLEAKRMDKVRKIRESKVRRPAAPAPGSEPEPTAGKEPAAVNA